MSNPERFDDLLSRYLDDALSAAEQAELCEWLANPERAERFLEMTKLNAEIAGLLAAPVPDGVMAGLVLSDLQKRAAAPVRVVPRARVGTARGPVGQQTSSLFRALKWAALFVAMLALPVIYFSDFWPSARQARLAAVQGEVYFIDASGQAQLTGQQPLNKAGKLKTVGRESRASIVLGDGTRVDVGGDSVLAAELATDKPRFFLEEGSLESQISKQPVDRPLTFATAEAEAIVKGTALNLVTWPHHTRVVVTEGEVLVKRLEDGEEVHVRAGYHVLVAPRTKLVASPNVPAPKHR